MNIKGKSLERAIELIEKHVLISLSPQDKGKITFEVNKVVVKHGVKHEIDAYVSVDLNIGTDLIYIFECKNYGNKVISKNEIIIFEEKIRVCNAQKGFFVGKKFGKDAINQSKLNERIDLLEFTENSFSPKDFLSMKSLTVSEKSTFSINYNPPITFPIDNLSLLQIEINSKKYALKDLVNEIVEDFFFGSKKNITVLKNEILHKELVREIKEPIINGVRTHVAKIYVTVFLEEVIPIVIYDFDIKQKGHYIKLKGKDFTGTKDNVFEITKVGKNINIHTITFE